MQRPLVSACVRAHARCHRYKTSQWRPARGPGRPANIQSAQLGSAQNRNSEPDSQPAPFLYVYIYRGRGGGPSLSWDAPQSRFELVSIRADLPFRVFILYPLRHVPPFSSCSAVKGTSSQPPATVAGFSSTLLISRASCMVVPAVQHDCTRRNFHKHLPIKLQGSEITRLPLLCLSTFIFNQYSREA
jgi:hypothetical protein